MLAIAISVNLYLLVSVVLAAFLIGFLFRSTQIRLLRGKIVDLEKGVPGKCAYHDIGIATVLQT